MKKFADFTIIKENNLKYESLISNIRDIIQSEISLRDVPYSRVDGAQEVDPESMDRAANAIIEFLKNETVLKLE